jgi:predicted porin
MITKKQKLLGLIIAIVCVLFVCEGLSTQAEALAAENVQELQRVIDAQQRQNETQQGQIEAQQKQLDAQNQLLQDLQKQMESFVGGKPAEEDPAVTDKPDAQPVVASKKSTLSSEKVVTSGEDRVKLSISGFVNRAVNVVNDGKDTDAYFVDNDNSESRVDFDGTARINDDLTLASKIELTIAPDKAGNVSQVNKESGDVFDQRITEVSLDSKHFGKLSLGKGYTASYGTASRDLSQTSVISYVTVADTAGGMLFRQTDDDSLTDLNIAQAFQSFDGLNRRSRVRYDTPAYHGFHFSTSLLTDQKYDAALWWGGQGYGFKAVGGASVADPKLDDTSLQYAGSFSLLHEDTRLNLTLSAGLQERDTQDDAGNLYAKIGWITDFFSVGDTAFSVDYGQTENQPAEDSEGYTAGFAAVQFFEEYGTEVYFLYRKYSLDRNIDPDVYDIDVVSIGTRVKF